MKTKKRNMNKTIEMLVSKAIICAFLCIGCSSSDPSPVQTGIVKGTVTDENGNAYPNTALTFSKGSESFKVITNSDGFYEGKTNDVGSYAIDIELPLSSVLVGNPTMLANVQGDQTATNDFIIRTQSLKAHLNFGSVQLLEEIVDKDGNTPTNANEPLFAKNIFDPPLGQLHKINAPDGHQISLAEFQTANGSLLVNCNGNSSSVEVSLEGMIPNGTYTFWLAYLKRTRKVGEPIDFANDFVNFTNPPIGASDGSENIVVADANGNITTTLEHPSCILTDEAALVVPILYHLNGKTFGGGHVPDPEEMVHMLVYFQ